MKKKTKTITTKTASKLPTTESTEGKGRIHMDYAVTAKTLCNNDDNNNRLTTTTTTLITKMIKNTATITRTTTTTTTIQQ